ncbi:hypothetical protein OAG1_23470 [Agarivorans sp. OAG1]|uniref:cupin domain-containing protein n=1 Tax=Agarivorans sp. OAG1 TaxID=3082387 RepID=UPI002B295A80|nr:hypothetical protein OAG1_23470 [Agarivorans sp. OAG1]
MPIKVITLSEAFKQLRFVSERRPESTAEELAGAFSELSAYRNGGIYIGHYAGNSEWERHSEGDEIVQIIEGSTSLILLQEEGEQRISLSAGQLVVVPQNQWHRFETPEAVKVMTVTPQPTVHQVTKPTFSQ